MRLTAGEFGRYCENNKPKDIWFNSDIQDWTNEIIHPSFRLNFSSLKVLNNPNAVFLRGDTGSLQLNCVKYIDLDDHCIFPDITVKVTCGAYGTDKFDREYVMIIS